MSLLIQNPGLGFKGVKALNDIHIRRDRARFSVIGPNGAGKTSLLTASRVYHTRGLDNLRWKATTWPEANIDSALGIARTFKTLRSSSTSPCSKTFSSEDTRITVHGGGKSLLSRKATEEELRHREHIEDIIDFNLESVRDMPVSVLYGIQTR